MRNSNTYNPNRLYKDPRNGRIMGVCAGIADYFDIRPGVIRLMALIGLFMSGFIPAICVYFLLGFVMSPKPDEIYEKPEEDKFWREARTKPDYTSVDLRKRFESIDKRIQSMEAFVTSKQFRLSRELRDLERE